NTDVTSLQSGTVIKAVLIYVSDYVTKPALKTHVFFDVIKSVFQRNKEQPLLGKSQHDKARKLMTQMVNMLGAKLEIGAPMICSYLLGLPDHYTNHTFVTFYWRSFVAEVKNDWKVEGDVIEEIKIHIKRKDNAIIGICRVEDYIHRPSELEHLSLYEWICRCEHMHIRAFKPNTKTSDTTDTEHSDTDSIIKKLEEHGDNCSDAGYIPLMYSQQSTQSTLIDDIPVDTIHNPSATSNNKVKYPKYMFLVTHPLHDTHYVSVKPEALRHIPNFVGGLLPRHNVGDCEYYCITMLTLFKPWHCGKDLKSVDTSWDVAFTEFKLLPWQAKIIINFNLRYECLDAKNDYNAQMRQGEIQEAHLFDTNWSVLDHNNNVYISSDDIDTGISGDSEQIATKLGTAYMK
ncbi:hypothetical protein IW262DRAFT_1267607, partial [Armillaria fumosa]